MGALTLLSFLVVFLMTLYSGRELPNLMEFIKAWQNVGEYIRADFGEFVFFYVFIGLWLGAASHTLTDIAGSFVKTGRITEFL